MPFFSLNISFLFLCTIKLDLAENTRQDSRSSCVFAFYSSIILMHLKMKLEFAKVSWFEWLFVYNFSAPLTNANYMKPRLNNSCVIAFISIITKKIIVYFVTFSRESRGSFRTASIISNKMYTWNDTRHSNSNNMGLELKTRPQDNTMPGSMMNTGLMNLSSIKNKEVCLFVFFFKFIQAL